MGGGGGGLELQVEHAFELVCYVRMHMVGQDQLLLTIVITAPLQALRAEQYD